MSVSIKFDCLLKQKNFDIDKRVFYRLDNFVEHKSVVLQRAMLPFAAISFKLCS